ncbi:MAG: arsenate reductase [Cellvibrionales bacterium]|nr:arsenate reductase [Cellvibrionales bacterium]
MTTSKITLYGIKNCDTVKKAQKWLDAAGIEFNFHDFRKDGLTETQVSEWLKTIPLEKLVNKRSTTWKQLPDTTKDSLSIHSAPALCAKFETLIKRPVLEYADGVDIGFSDKQYQAIFQK